MSPDCYRNRTYHLLPLKGRSATITLKHHKSYKQLALTRTLSFIPFNIWLVCILVLTCNHTLHRCLYLLRSTTPVQNLVRVRGVEPPCLAPLEPKSSVSANSTTLALNLAVPTGFEPVSFVIDNHASTLVDLGTYNLAVVEGIEPPSTSPIRMCYMALFYPRTQFTCSI